MRTTGPALTLAALLLLDCGSNDAPGRGLDLVVITLDTTRADRIGAYGYAAGKTPTIDALAARGVRFEHAFAPTPTTLPSHTTLFTGLYPPNHGVRANGSYALAAGPTTLAETLTAAGYSTAAFIGAFPLDSRFGLDQGFAVYDDRVNPRTKSSQPLLAERSGSEVTDAALAWIDAHAASERPLFVWAHYFDPHAPYAPPPPAEGYDGEVTFADAQVGRLLDGIEAARGLDRTLVVLTADHGESLGEHGESTHGVFVYDATLRVPLILANPRILPVGSVVADRVVSLADVFPTTVELLGVDPGSVAVDGRHLLADPREHGEPVYFETVETLVRYGWAPLRGLRTSSEKLIEAPQPEYYRIDEDPGELANRFEADRAPVEALEEKLRLAFGELDPTELLSSAHQADRETLERLASLGYVHTGTADPASTLRDPKKMLPLWNRIDGVYRLAESGRMDEALREVDRIVDGDPGNGRAWFIRGMLLHGTGRLDEAAESLRTSARLVPGAANLSRLAQVLFQQGRFEEGDAAVERARRIDPQSGMVPIAEGVGAVARGRLDEGLAAFERAIAIDPANAATTARELAALVEKMR